MLKCIEIYQEPVTLECGHNYCLKCINETVQTNDDKFPIFKSTIY